MGGWGEEYDSLHANNRYSAPGPCGDERRGRVGDGLSARSASPDPGRRKDGPEDSRRRRSTARAPHPGLNTSPRPGRPLVAAASVDSLGEGSDHPLLASAGGVQRGVSFRPAMSRRSTTSGSCSPARAGSKRRPRPTAGRSRPGRTTPRRTTTWETPCGMAADSRRVSTATRRPWKRSRSTPTRTTTWGSPMPRWGGSTRRWPATPTA